MDAGQLHTLAAAAAPIVGVSVGNSADKQTWWVEFAAEATQDQRDAVAALIDAYQTPSALDRRKVGMATAVLAERAARLASGFDYAFGDARGTHRIGTTLADMAGWDEVTKAASALINVGQGTHGIEIVTETGPTVVTAQEWQAVLIAALQFRQPIFMRSFALQGEIAAAADDAALDAIDIAAGWSG